VFQNFFGVGFKKVFGILQPLPGPPLIREGGSRGFADIPDIHGVLPLLRGDAPKGQRGCSQTATTALPSAFAITWKQSGYKILKLFGIFRSHTNQ